MGQDTKKRKFQFSCLFCMYITLKNKLDLHIDKIENRPYHIVKSRPQLFGLYIYIITPKIYLTHYKIQVKKLLNKLNFKAKNIKQEQPTTTSAKVGSHIVFKPSWAKYEADMHSDNAETQRKATDAFLAERAKETASSRVARDWEEGRKKEIQSNKKYYLRERERRRQNA